MSTTFAVDEVKPATDLRETRPLSESLGDALAVGGDPERRVIPISTVQPLLAATHVAFGEHRPLVLSPDAVWLTIAHGVAQHVRLHADTLRPRLVRHAGKKELNVGWQGSLPHDAESWTRVVHAFRDQVAAELGAGRARLFECDFSTSGDVERVASQVVLMDAVAPFFEYVMTCICGIPEVTLLGTVADWQAIRTRVDVIAELDLEHWARSLRPICDQLVRAAQGDPDWTFWRWMHKPTKAYGGDVITGWIGRLYPYLKGEGRYDVPNPMLEEPFAEPDGGKKWPAGIRTSSVHSGRSSVSIRIEDHTTGQQGDCTLEAGLWGVEQDARGRLEPIAAWVVRPPVAREAAPKR